MTDTTSDDDTDDDGDDDDDDDGDDDDGGFKTTKCGGISTSKTPTSSMGSNQPTTSVVRGVKRKLLDTKKEEQIKKTVEVSTFCFRKNNTFCFYE